MRPGAAVAAGTSLAAVSAAIALYNRATVPRLDPHAEPTDEPVTVCIPARNEVDALPDLIGDLRAQRGVSGLRVLILDDDSTDDTFRAATRAIDGDDRFELRRRTGPPPAGWGGKTAACRDLAEHADARDGVLIFLDADVRLRRGALVAAVARLRSSGADLLTAWPDQLAESAAERLVQPLLCWSWGSSLPMTLSDASLRTSTAVACGQFLVFDAVAYRRSGGHAEVFDSRTEDLDIARVFRRSGRRTAVAMATQLSSCRMYRDRNRLEAGYRRWLWTSYGSPAGSAVVIAVAVATYVLPPLAGLLGTGATRRWGLRGYACAVTGRLAARSTETGRAPTGADVVNSAAHPVSVAAYARLLVLSHRDRRRGTATWKGRAL